MAKKKNRNRYYLSDGTSLIDYCTENKLRYSTILRRVQSGLTPDEAIKPLEHDKRRDGNKAKYFINGVSVKELSRTETRPHYSYISFVLRKKKGMSNEEAFYKHYPDKN